jgi:hypothetical protein
VTPNRKQWIVIWGAYALAIVARLDALNRDHDGGLLLVFIVIGAGLLVWQLATPTTSR